MSWFTKWRPYQGDLNVRPVATNEYLPPAQTVMLGLQHVLAMFGATVLAPILMGFDANLAIMMSGICTILFFIMTGGKVPSYLGSSFAHSIRGYYCLWGGVCFDWIFGHGNRHKLD